MRSENPVEAISPVLIEKDYASRSVFEPGALLREARRQKNLQVEQVPPVCILDPDGDIGRFLKRSRLAAPFANWPCYHTELYTFALGAQMAGIICCAVGAPFAVLLAEQLFACGCKLLLSVTSAGQLVASAPPPYFVIIDRSLRDEGTSHHYAKASEFAHADRRLVQGAASAAADCGMPAVIGGSWTTDAPFRETTHAVESAKAKGLLAVEMEAAALYTFASVRKVPVLCLAHVTNSMGQAGQDFEKGQANGATEALVLLRAIGERLLPIAVST